MSLLDIVRWGLLVSLAASVIYGAFAVHRGPSLGRSALKAIPVGVLAWVNLFTFGPLLLTLALGLCALGDVALSRPGNRWFLAGLGAFAFGHLAFVALFAISGASAAPILTPMGLICAAVLLVAGMLLGRLYSRHAGDLMWPVRVYVAIIVAMGLAALGLPVEGMTRLAVAGAAFFVASDALLGHQLFMARTVQRAQSVAIWVLYYLAQLVFLFAFNLGYAT